MRDFLSFVNVDKLSGEECQGYADSGYCSSPNPQTYNSTFHYCPLTCCRFFYDHHLADVHPNCAQRIQEEDYCERNRGDPSDDSNIGCPKSCDACSQIDGYDVKPPPPPNSGWGW